MPPFFERFGFPKLASIAAESIIVDMQKELVELAVKDPTGYQAAFELLLRTAGDPSILGMALHLLYVGRKAGG